MCKAARGGVSEGVRARGLTGWPYAIKYTVRGAVLRCVGRVRREGVVDILGEHTHRGGWRVW